MCSPAADTYPVQSRLVLLGRVLKYINMTIGAALLGALFAAYWFAWRVLPQTSGQLEAPVTNAATISRDSLGVPHIQAGSEQDALFLQGYVTAQDRLWQMDTLRRIAAGELAELFGRKALITDQQARRLRLARIAEASYTALNPTARATLRAYARGVNFYIEQNQNRLPVEFSLLRYDPKPWSPVDSVLIALQWARWMSSGWERQLQKLALLAGGDAAKVKFLYPARSVGQWQRGAHAWAISGAWTLSGRPILANDPHFEASWPSLWYFAHLSAPGLNVEGATIPGLPGILIGHNENIGWGLADLGFDVQDLYAEDFDPTTGVYWFHGQRQQAALERQTIRIKGEAPFQMLCWVTAHGPVIASENGKFFSLKWTAADVSQFQYPFIELDHAKDWHSFTSALAQISVPAAAFVYADRQGNIGWHAAGKLPIRTNNQGDVPSDGSSGEHEWKGYIPFDQLPAEYNPPSGIALPATPDCASADYPYFVSGDFSGGYRAQRIKELLKASKHWKAAQMLAVQTDTYSKFHHFLARQIVATAERWKTKAKPVTTTVDLLRNWNGQMERGLAAPMIVTLAFHQIRKAVAECASPGNSAKYDSAVTSEAVEMLLKTRPSDWFGDYDSLLLRCLTDALEEGARIQGKDTSKWDYGVYNHINLIPPVIGQLPLVGRYFSIGTVPMGGSPTSVQQQVRNFGPSMRMVLDLADWDNSLWVLTLGQSGQVFSKHFRDQWEAFRKGKAFTMEFFKIQSRKALAVIP